jgi:hypothetical protein
LLFYSFEETPFWIDVGMRKMLHRKGSADYRQVFYFVGVVLLFVGFGLVLYDMLQVGIEVQGGTGKAGEGISALGVVLLVTKRGIFGISEKNLPARSHQEQFLAAKEVSGDLLDEFRKIYDYIFHSGALQSTKGRTLKTIGKIIGFAGTGWALGTVNGLESLIGIMFGVVGNADTIVGFGSKKYWMFWIEKVAIARNLWDQIEQGWTDKNPECF